MSKPTKIFRDWFDKHGKWICPVYEIETSDLEKLAWRAYQLGRNHERKRSCPIINTISDGSGMPSCDGAGIVIIEREGKR